MSDKKSSVQGRRGKICGFLGGFDKFELNFAIKEFIYAERRYSKARDEIPFLSKKMPEGSVIPLMGLFDWEAEVAQMKFDQGGIYQNVGIRSQGLVSLMEFMGDYNLAPIFSFCFHGELSSSGCTLYVMKVPDDFAEKMREKGLFSDEEIVTESDNVQGVVDEINKLVSGISDEKTFFKLAEIHSLLDGKNNAECNRAADMIVPILGMVVCAESSPSFDFSVAELMEGEDYEIPIGAGGHPVNAMVLEMGWLRGAAAILNYALKAVGFKTIVESPAPRKIRGGLHRLRFSS